MRRSLKAVPTYNPFAMKWNPWLISGPIIVLAINALLGGAPWWIRLVAVLLSAAGLIALAWILYPRKRNSEPSPGSS